MLNVFYMWFQEEATEKKKKSQKVSKNKAEKKSRESKTDAEEKDVADDEMASDEDELDESFEKKACVIVQHSLNNVLESDDEEEDLSEDDEDHRKVSCNINLLCHWISNTIKPLVLFSIIKLLPLGK